MTGQELWRAFDAAWYTFAYPVVGRLLQERPTLQSADIYRALGSILRHDPNPFFSETWYTGRYLPVADAIRTGLYKSGFDHFCRDGYPDLAPHWLFDPGYYRQQVAASYRRPFDPAIDGDAYDHFLRIGQHEGLTGHRLFDPDVYLSLAQSDVIAHINQDGPFTTFLHHIRAGDPEPVVSTYFDPAWYLNRYPHVAQEISQGNFTCALHHFLQSPDAALHDPNPRFSERLYRAYFADIRQALRDGHLRSGFEHYLRHGQREARVTFPAGSAGKPDQGIARRPAPVTASFPLRTRQFQDVTFLPVTQDAPGWDNWRFGAFDPDGRSLDAFANDGMAGAIIMPQLAQHPGTFIYGGVLPRHYGHFLLDGLTNLWFLRQRPDLPVLWHWDPAIPDGQWPGWITQLWHLLGLTRHRHLHIRTPVRVQQVILPDPGGMRIHTMHPRQAAALAVHRATGPGHGKRVWLSRQGLPPSLSRLEPEDRIEAALQARGWNVVRPETLPVTEQADIFSTADSVSGVIGSAFHTVLLCAEPSAHLIPVVYRPGAALQFYDVIADARGLRQSFIVPDILPASDTAQGGVAEVRDVTALVEAICQTAGTSPA